jgi:hypothetical protein
LHDLGSRQDLHPHRVAAAGGGDEGVEVSVGARTNCSPVRVADSDPSFALVQVVGGDWEDWNRS